MSIDLERRETVSGEKKNLALMRLGPNQREDRSMRLRKNFEIDVLMTEPIIVEVVKVAKLCCLGHVESMGEIEWSPTGRTS